jgi:hypothetical protein
MIRAGLLVRFRENSSVIHVGFRHPDATLLQPVLRETIEEFRTQNPDLGGGAAARISQISLIQAPSAPLLDYARTARLQMLVVAAGLLAGLGWIWAKSSAELRSKLAG